jgi:CRP-like cAMP-binding protein
LLDAAIHRAWIFRLGRLEAEARAAHLFCELHARLEMVGLAQDVSFALPLTQSDLGSGLIGHSQKMTVAASATAEKKTVGQRS